jgi:hypothetical protein
VTLRKSGPLKRIVAGYKGLLFGDKVFILASIFILGVGGLTYRSARDQASRQAAVVKEAAHRVQTSGEARAERAARALCGYASKDAEKLVVVYSELDDSCRALQEVDPQAKVCAVFRALLARGEKLLHGRKTLEKQLISLGTAPRLPPEPEYQKPAYHGAFLLGGMYRPQYGGEGILVERRGEYFVIEDAERPSNSRRIDYLTGYVDPTGRTMTTDIGRIGRVAQVVRVSSRETYLDDRRAYEVGCDAAVAEYREQRRNYVVQLDKAKKAIEKFASGKSLLESALASNFEELTGILKAGVADSAVCPAGNAQVTTNAARMEAPPSRAPEARGGRTPRSNASGIRHAGDVYRERDDNGNTWLCREGGSCELESYGKSTLDEHGGENERADPLTE